MALTHQELTRDERRRFPRVGKRIHVRAKVVDSSAPELRAETLDVSTGGVSIQTNRDVDPGTFLSLTMEGIAPQLVFEVRGRVAWCNAITPAKTYEAGVELLGLTRSKLEKLLALICDEGWDAGAEGDRRYIHLQKRLLIAWRRANSWLNRTRHHAHTQDISLRGMTIHLERPVDPETRMNMHLLLPDGQPEPVECFGEAIEKCASAAGSEWTTTVEFDDLAEEHRARLGAFLSQELLRR
jgi:c-di-GMP-binding flagellar brake protein YcgR